MDKNSDVNNIVAKPDPPLYNTTFRKFGDIIYISGIGAHVPPFEIKAHTKIVLDEMERRLKLAGSSMNRVLKVSIFINDMKDFEKMNEVYAGRFGSNPPVRTTMALGSGNVPNDSVVEMDCIAYLL